MRRPKSINLLPTPYPYNSLLAICSDLDETPLDGSYFEIAKFLNTIEETRFGPGVNLEVGNTIYFDMPAEQFSYWNGSDDDRIKIRRMIRSGHIDCLHSFGDLVSNRERALECLTELESNHCKLQVWIDHAQAPSNFDQDIMEGFGANPESPCYHADMTCGGYGVQFVWKGRVTSVIGQNCPRSYRGLFNWRAPGQSLVTIGKELAKVTLGRFGNQKYRMHRDNRVLRKSTLVDGTPVYEFMRFNPSFLGVSRHEDSRGFGNVVTRQMLREFSRRRAIGILYTHLGKSGPVTSKSRKAFRLLKEFYGSKDILITTTRRLLGFVRAVEELEISYGAEDGIPVINVRGDLPRREIQGLSWRINQPTALVNYNGERLKSVAFRKDTQTSTYVAHLPWNPLRFPELD